MLHKFHSRLLTPPYLRRLWNWLMDYLVGNELLNDCIQRAVVNKLNVHSDKWCPPGSHTRLFSISTVDTDSGTKGILSSFLWDHVQRSHKKDGEKLLSRATSDRTRCNGFQVKEGRFRLHIRKNSFIVMLMNYWKRLQREVVDAPSLETFRVRLDRALSNIL